MTKNINLLFTYHIQPKPIQITRTLFSVNIDQPPASTFVRFILPHGPDAFFKQREIRSLSQFTGWTYVVVQTGKTYSCKRQIETKTKINDKPPKIFNSLERGNFLLVFLPCVVTDILVVPQSPAVL